MLIGAIRHAHAGCVLQEEKMSERIAFRMNLNPGQAAEYKKRHDEIWPELSQALRDAGVSDYSIWLDPETNHLFATLMRTADHTMAELPKTEINRRWWDFMADLMQYNTSNEPLVVPLQNVFHME
jgi:L-rhamnose mutarotase